MNETDESKKEVNQETNEKINNSTNSSPQGESNTRTGEDDIRENLVKLMEEVRELKRVVTGEVENRKKLAKAILTLSNKVDQHLKGQMTLEDLQSCMQRVQEMVSILEGAGMLRQGEGSGGLLASALAQMMRQQQGTPTPPIERVSTSSDKLKKLLEEEEDDS
jgi:Asp-tRNA(Asn)/Glu-tRNA(Gln) amidotransferase B subunit